MVAGCKANRKGKKRTAGDSSEVRKQEEKGQGQTPGTSAPKKIVPTFGKASGKVSQKSPANKRRKISGQATKVKEEENIDNELISETEKTENYITEATKDVTCKEFKNCKESSTNIEGNGTTERPDLQSAVSFAASSEEKNCQVDASSSCYIEIEKIESKTKENEEGENSSGKSDNGVGNVNSDDLDQSGGQMDTQPADDLAVTKTLVEKYEKHSTGQLEPSDKMLCEKDKMLIISDATTNMQGTNVEQISGKIDLVKADVKTESISDDLADESRILNVVQNSNQHSQACNESKNDEEFGEIVKSNATNQQSAGEEIQENDVTAVQVSNCVKKKKEESLNLTSTEAHKDATLEKDLTDQAVSSKENTDANVIHTDAVQQGEESKPVISELGNAGNTDPTGNEDGNKYEEKGPQGEIGGKAASTVNGVHVSGVLEDVVQVCKQEVSSDWNDRKMSGLHDESCDKQIVGGTSNADTTADNRKNSIGSETCNSKDFCLTDEIFLEQQLKDEPFLEEQLKEEQATDLKNTVNQNDDGNMDFKDAEMTNSQIFMLDEEITTSPPRKLQYEDFNDIEDAPELKTLEDYASEGSVIMKGLIDELSSVTKMVVGMKRYMDSIKKPKQTKLYSMWK